MNIKQWYRWQKKSWKALFSRPLETQVIEWIKESRQAPPIRLEGFRDFGNRNMSS